MTTIIIFLVQALIISDEDIQKLVSMGFDKVTLHFICLAIERTILTLIPIEHVEMHIQIVSFKHKTLVVNVIDSS